MLQKTKGALVYPRKRIASRLSRVVGHVAAGGGAPPSRPPRRNGIWRGEGALGVRSGRGEGSKAESQSCHACDRTLQLDRLVEPLGTFFAPIRHAYGRARIGPRLRHRIPLQRLRVERKSVPAVERGNIRRLGVSHSRVSDRRDSM